MEARDTERLEGVLETGIPPAKQVGETEHNWPCEEETQVLLRARTKSG